MIRYGKMVQTAVAVTSRLAETYGKDDIVTSSLDIAQSRHLPKPNVAKVLTVLAKHKLVTGAPGPGGGYRLAKPPQSISLFDIVEIFEKQSDVQPCPLGPNWCGNGPKCAFHDKFLALKEKNEHFLKSTNFGAFRDR